MAIKRYYKRKRTTYRRFYKRKRMNRSRRVMRRAKNGNSQRFRALGGFPNIAWVTLKYQAQNVLDATSVATYALYGFRGNSIYDPDYSAITGGSVALYSVYEQLYYRYTVYKCTIKVTFQQVTAIPTYCYVFPYYNSSTAVVSPEYWQNCPGVKKILLQPYNFGNKTSATIRFTTTIKRIAGFSANDDACTATMNNNPAVQVYWWVACESIDGSNGAKVYMNTEIFYKTRLFERKLILENNT